MAEHETKLKLGRKLDKVEAAVASDNQVSALFRYDAQGKEQHVSLSIESDAMKVADVAAVFQLLHDRGVLPASESKTWINQPQASTQKFGPTTLWGGEDVEKAMHELKHGFVAATAVGTASASDAQATVALSRAALLKVTELERKLGELKSTLQPPGSA